MSTDCIICDDPRVKDIDRVLETPRSISKVSKEYGFARVTVYRHRGHRLIEENRAPITDLQKLKDTTQRIIDTTRDDKVRLGALQRMQGLLEHELRTRAEAADDGSAESFASHPAVVAVVDAVYRACVGCQSCTDRLLVELETVGARGVPAPKDTPGGGES